MFGSIHTDGSDNLGTKKCQFCAEEILEEAIKCKHCGSMLDESSSSLTKSEPPVESPTKSEPTIKHKKSKQVPTSVGCLIIIILFVVVIPFCMKVAEGPNERVKPTAVQSEQKTSDAVPTPLTEAQKAEKTEKILTQLKTIPVEEHEKNRDLYQQLSSMHPDNEKYKEKFNFYQGKIVAKRQKARAAAERKKKIEGQFSSWDGSHRNLAQTIKQGMNDPKSYEHVETVYWDRGDHLVVRTTFRGKNAFGGVVVNSVKAKVDLNGNVFQIIE